MQPRSVDEPVSRAPRWLLVGVVALVILPLGAAIAGQLVSVGADYQAAGDLADIELHTRDVGAHPVEVGQYSRGDWAHPGPALFYALALPYRLTGSHSVGANVGALVINALSVVGILLVAHRRGGEPLLCLAALGCAVVLRSFGPMFVIEPWNPSVPVLPFGLFLMLVWELACGSAWALPVAVAVGTFCVQTHIAYAPLVVPLVAIAAGVGWWTTLRRGASDDGPAPRRAVVRASWASAAVLAVMWLPPALEELGPGDGNLTRILHYFREGDGETHTLGDGYRNLAVQFGAAPEWVNGKVDLTLRREPDLGDGAPFPVLLVPFLAGAAVWWRRRSTEALALVGLATVAALLSLVAISRTVGPIYHYRLGWTRLVGMTALLTTAWALWTVLVERWPRLERRLLVPLCLAGVVFLAGVGAPRFARSDPPQARFSDDIEQLAPAVLSRLPDEEGAVIFRCDGDESCSYLAGLVLWLERRGVQVRVDNPLGVVATGAPHRVFEEGPIRDVLHVSTNANFHVRAARPETEVVAHLGSPPTAERARIAQQIVDLDAAHAAGDLDDEAHFLERVGLSEALGTSVGVVSEPFEA